MQTSDEHDVSTTARDGTSGTWVRHAVRSDTSNRITHHRLVELEQLPDDLHASLLGGDVSARVAVLKLSSEKGNVYCSLITKHFYNLLMENPDRLSRLQSSVICEI